MPSLGFLRKKKGHADPSSPTSPTAAKHVESLSTPRAPASHHGLESQSSSAPSPSKASSLPQHPSGSGKGRNTTSTSTAADATETTASSKPAEAGHNQQQMNRSNNDGSSTNHNDNHDYASSTFSTPLGSHGIIPPPSASPGTDPSRLQHQQQQAHPPPPNPVPASLSSASTMQQPGQPQLHQLQSQHQQQPQQSQHQPQSQPTGNSLLQPQQPRPGGPQPAAQPRQTKGKYSLQDFDIQRTLGTGSFGRVHLVQSKHNQRFYAVKVLKKAQVVKMKQVEHTNDERRMLSDVKHPFLITLWGTFQDWKNLYMVMDFVEGGELFSLLRKSGRFPNPVAKFYAAEVTLALEYLHSKNIIYRDLKPENLLLDRHGHLKITDFGFAKRVPDKTWTLCGTPDYLAPEVVSNKGYNKSVDWWSLGILIYEMLCGYTPFWDGGSPMKIYENITKGVVKYPGYINPDAQNLLERLITADLTKRLGNLYGGSQDVKSHSWFSEVTWDRLARKDIDAPYTPPVKAGMGDASQFDRYPEDPDKYGGANGHDEFGHLFTEF